MIELHNFVSPGLQVLAAARNGCRLGLAKCRDLIAIKISLLSHLDPVAVKVLQQCVLFYLILKCILNSFIFMFQHSSKGRGHSLAHQWKLAAIRWQGAIKQRKAGTYLRVGSISLKKIWNGKNKSQRGWVTSN